MLRRYAPRNDARIFSAVFFASSLLLATPALAAPRSIDDCEAIKEADAYNRCLASFGPMRGQHGATYPGVASRRRPQRESFGPQRLSPAVALGARAAFRGRGGRVRMEFTPGRR